MPPLIAFLACLAFVIFLLKVDHRQFPEASRALWIPTVWALLAFSRPFGSWFGKTEPGSMEAGSPLDRVLLTGLLILALIALSKRNIDWHRVIRENSWLILLVGFMLISTSWSPTPFTSFKRWTREFIAVVMTFVILSETDPRKALASVLRRISYILLPFSLLLIKYPRYGIDYGRWSGELMWRGVNTQKNGLAILCALSALILVWTLIRRWQGRDKAVVRYQTLIEVFLLFLALIMLMGPRRTLTYSATSTVALVLALLTVGGLYLLTRRGPGPSRAVFRVAVLVFVLYGTITPFLGKLPVLDISSTMERDETLTGRSEIWAYLVPLAMARPVAGHGFGGFWTTGMRQVTSSHAHNGYLDIILDLGFLGLMLTAMFLLSCSSKAHQAFCSDPDWGALFLSLLVMITAHNIAESTVNSLTSSLTAVVLFFSVAILATPRGAEAAEGASSQAEGSS